VAQPLGVLGSREKKWGWFWFGGSKAERSATICCVRGDLRCLLGSVDQPSFDGLAVEVSFLWCSRTSEPSIEFLLMMTPCSSIPSSTVTSRSMAELSAQVRETELTGNIEPREEGGSAVSSSEAEPWSSSSRSLIMPGLLSV
jgi:hypothetical protein